LRFYTQYNILGGIEHEDDGIGRCKDHVHYQQPAHSITASLVAVLLDD